MLLLGSSRSGEDGGSVWVKYRGSLLLSCTSELFKGAAAILLYANVMLADPSFKSITAIYYSPSLHTLGQ